MIIALTTWFQIIPDWTWIDCTVKVVQNVQSQESIRLETHHLLFFAQLPLSPFRSDLIGQHVDIFLIQNIYWLITFSQVLFFKWIEK